MAVAGHPASETRDLTLNVGGMNCASCVAHVDRAIQSLPGIEASSVNLARGMATIRFNPQQVQPDQIAAAVTRAGFPSALDAPGAAGSIAEEQRINAQRAHARAWLRRALVGIALWLPIESIHWILTLTRGGHSLAGHDSLSLRMGWIGLAASTISLVFVGGAFYRSALKALARRTSNMDTLIAMGASVAYAYSLIALAGYQARWWTTLPDLYFMEAAGLLALISLGHWLEARARDAAGSAIRELLNLTPPTALRLANRESTLGSQRLARSLNVLNDAPKEDAAPFAEVAVADLHVGDRVLIRPGDRVATDGVVVEGRSTINESMITGEPMPATRTVGDTVIGGTVNQDGRLIVRVAKVGSETALAQIVKLVETAQSSKPPVQKLADQISAIFVPTVLVIGLLTGAGWYAWAAAHGWPAAQAWAAVAKAVCSVLIVACPCALGLAVPAALMVGTGLGARRGILIRDIDALQQAERINTVVLDKTGTITRGKPAVGRVITMDGVDEKTLLRVAAAAEQYSEHPLAKALVQHARALGIDFPASTDFNNSPGLGITAMVDGKRVVVGTADLLRQHAVPIAPSASHDPPASTFVEVAFAGDDGQLVRAGAITFTDELKHDSAEAVRELRALGLRIVLLTGDNRSVAEAVASAIGVQDVRAGVKPDGKAHVIRELQSRDATPPGKAACRVAMVGDGVNDAPALAAADLGIAIGSGSDVAKETGGIVLVSGSLQGVASAIRLSRFTMVKIRQNLFFALIYNVLAIPLAAMGLMSPLLAAAAMALSDVTVIGNALLLRRAKID